MSKTSEKYGYNSLFPERFRALIAERRVTQRTIASICSVKPQSVSQWINGDTRPDILSLAKIAEYFNVTTDYLLGVNDSIRVEKNIADIVKDLLETSIKLLSKEYIL